MNYKIIHEPEQKKFATVVDGHVGFTEYEIYDGYFDITHTIVDEAIEGRGIAADLVKTAYDYAIAKGLKPKATCPYAAAWLKRHPEIAAKG